MRDFFSKNKKTKSVDNLGLSKTGADIEERLLNKDGTFNLDRKGEHNPIYHQLITMSWTKFLLYVLLTFTFFNGIFALIYLFLGIENIANVEDLSFIENLVNLFHFSVQTMTTIGYGHLYPTGTITHIVTSIQALLGLMSFALMSGLVYGRFSNPQADIKYSKNMLISHHPKMGKTLQVRLANRNSHQLLQADARILLLMNKTKNNNLVKEYKELKLELNHIYFLPLNWTLVHKIDENSPLYGFSIDSLNEHSAEFLILVSAYDDTFSHMIYSQSSYVPNEIAENTRWEMAYSINNKGRRVFDINLLDKYVKE